MKENKDIDLQYSGPRATACHPEPWWLSAVVTESPKPLEKQAETVLLDPDPAPVAAVRETDPTACRPRATPEFTCDRCWSHEFRDSSIHHGQSTRRDCAVCNRTAGFPLWYGKERAL